MKHLLFAALCSLIAAPLAAQDFSEGSEARSWNLYAEVPARFTATVTDPLCELAGQCTPDCGGGRQQLVLLREADGAMVFPLKNGQPAFTGAAVELAPFCGQTVEVDGLMIDDPEIGAVNVYLVQRIRPEGGEWRRANQWTKDWATRHPEAAGDGPWFRRDPRVLSEIEREGYLGLGAEADAAFIADWF
ncbi:hypothetical protein JANAI62_08570 [Jannaschia pagri]|uniref:Uncharacterized protein n=1 Tax=Jannaschia pagri TaxID=2829797 RepID=A0ABQ4NII6_9RHOB|nr:MULTISPECIES: hypothetical protein [unclassified Jannaschia]GIT89658.1 hypothetical protein JANAI61_01160 [Jannaschia sp. AI_61]GIT94234.1 hypothetical protein JANAI62_08570 [Jannaschia sp. AI_62]